MRLRPQALISLATFALITLGESTGVTQNIDVSILQWFGQWRTPLFTTVMQFFSTVGSGKVEIPFALLVVAFLWLQSRRTSAWRYLAFCVGGEVLYASPSSYSIATARLSSRI